METGKLAGPWNELADEILYLEKDAVTYKDLEQLASRLKSAESATLLELIGPEKDGTDLRDAALAVCDANAGKMVRLVEAVQIELEAPPFKRPEMLVYLEELQAHILADEKVGKVTSAVDALKKAAYELQYKEDKSEAANKANFSVPGTPAAVGQVFTQLEGMKKKDALFHLVARDYAGGNMWVQLSSGDNRDM